MMRGQQYGRTHGRSLEGDHTLTYGEVHAELSIFAGGFETLTGYEHQKGGSYSLIRANFTRGCCFIPLDNSSSWTSLTMIPAGNETRFGVRSGRSDGKPRPSRARR
jgi:hypothetical protein